MSKVLAEKGSYGVVTQVSRSSGVTRQTLYSWKAKGQAALERGQEQNIDTRIDTKASSHRQSNIDTFRQKSASVSLKAQLLKDWTTSKKSTILAP